MSAAILNLTIEAGSTFKQLLYWADAGNTPMNMVGCSAFIEFRADSTSTTVLLSLNTTNGRITINTVTGLITIQLTATETDLITWTNGVYDLEIKFPMLNGEIPVYKLCRGKVKVVPSVTRGA